MRFVVSQVVNQTNPYQMIVPAFSRVEGISGHESWLTEEIDYTQMAIMIENKPGTKSL